MTPIIEIIGGAGAFASLKIHQMLLSQFYKRNLPLCDADFPYILHKSVPFKCMSHKGVDNGRLASEEVAVEVSKSIPGSTLLLGCFSLNSFLPKSDSVVNLIDVAQSLIPVDSKCLVLCSESSRLYRLFGEAPHIAYPSEALGFIVDTVIADVIKEGSSQAALMLDIVLNSEIKHFGYTHVLLGCTELLCINLNPQATLLNPVDVAISSILENLYASV